MSIWRVYGHVSSGRIFYIGSGLGSRCVQRSGRTKQWHDLVKSLGDQFDVRIFAEYHNRSDALAHESRLIDEHRPQLVNIRRVKIQRPPLREFSDAERVVMAENFSRIQQLLAEAQ